MEAVVKSKSLGLAHVIGGSLFIALCAQIAIPFGSVPFTLQTMAVLLLAMQQGSRLATLSVMLYLIEATAGLPVLAGGQIDPLCLIGTRAGYLMSFPIVALVSGYLFEKGRPLAAIVTGQAIILSLGASVLSFFIGMQNAILWGMLPFIPAEVCKGAFLFFFASKKRG